MASFSTGKSWVTYAATSSVVTMRASPPTASMELMNTSRLAKRWSGSRASAIRQISSSGRGTDGSSSEGRFRWAEAMRSTTSSALWPVKGRRPQSCSYSITPAA